MTYQTKSLLLNVEGFRLTIRNVNEINRSKSLNNFSVLD